MMPSAGSGGGGNIPNLPKFDPGSGDGGSNTGFIILLGLLGGIIVATSVYLYFSPERQLALEIGLLIDQLVSNTQDCATYNNMLLNPNQYDLQDIISSQNQAEKRKFILTNFQDVLKRFFKLTPSSQEQVVAYLKSANYNFQDPYDLLTYYRQENVSCRNITFIRE